MSGIKDPILSIAAQLNTIPVTTRDSIPVQPTVRIWNNQMALLIAGKIEAIQLPFFGIEVVPKPEFEDIGQGFRSADLGFRIHIIHEYLDGNDGNFEQDLEIFGLRDLVIGYLTGFKPTACGILTSPSEEQDYDHGNLYHYIVDFICDFIDSRGSRYDQTKPDAYADGPLPITLQATPNYVPASSSDGDGTPAQQQFIIPTKPL